MKKCNYNRSLCLVIFGFILFYSLPVFASILPDSFDRALDDIRSTAQTIKNFSQTVYAVSAFVVRLIGFKAIILAFFVLIVSAGLVSLGVPSGRWSFISSMGIVNAIWILWGYSSGSTFAAFFPGFLRANCTVASPWLIAAFCIFMYRLIRKWYAKKHRKPREDIKQLFEASIALQANLLPIVGSDGSLTSAARESAEKLRDCIESVLATEKTPSQN